MQEADVFINAILAVAILLFLSSFIAALLRKIKMPYTVVLVVVGIFLSFLAKTTEAFAFLNVLELSPELIFYIFLPVLIFESAYNIKFNELKDNLITISSLAIGALLLSTLIIGVLLYYGLNFFGIEIPLLVTLLFGALISATDPIAVLALFREMRVPKRLYLLFEGESLFNDGIAVVVFQIILASVLLGSVSVFSAISGVGDFLYVVGMAIIFGSFMGYIFSFLIGRIRNIFTVEITLTLILAHTTFILAEHFLKASGIIATVFAALVVGGYGRSKISPSVLDIMEKFWEYSAFVVNSLIFLLIGLSIDNVNFMQIAVAAVLGIIIVLFARAVSVFSVFPFVHKFTKEEKTPFSWQVLLAWGGLRGALALAIALLLPEDFVWKDFILSLTLTIILFSLVVQATTVKKLIKKLKIDKLSDEESFELEEGFVFIDEMVRNKLQEMKNAGVVSDKIFEKLDKKYSQLKKDAKDRISQIIKNHGRDFSHQEMVSILKRQALGIEKKVLYTLFTHFEISQTTYDNLNTKLEKQINRLEKGKSQIMTEEEKEKSRKLRKLKVKILEFLSQIDLFKKLIIRSEIKDKITRYRMIRARALTAKEVVKQLKQLAKLDIFSDKKAIEEVISQYKNFEEKNKKEAEKMKEQDPELINLIDYSIANNSLIRLEKSILSELHKNGVIADKIYDEVDDYLNDLIYKKTKKVIGKYIKKSGGAGIL